MKHKSHIDNLGVIEEASETRLSSAGPGMGTKTIFLLAGSVGLMMTGFGIVLPVFARRLGEFGDGVQELSLMTVAFAIAQFVAAPIMGSLADRYGRRPMILLALAAFTASNIGFLLAGSATVFIGLRAFEGTLTAGLFPATMGIVADVVPEDRRARWVGIVMGCYGAGFIFGPTIGAVLYDAGGYVTPFIISASLACAAFIAAFFLVRETRTAIARKRDILRNARTASMAPSARSGLIASLPRPLHVFGTLLLIDFMAVFSWGFVEPEMVFYFYDDLKWTTVMFGVVVGAYGLAEVAGQMMLGRMSDKFGRRSMIITGLLIASLLFFGLAYARSFAFILAGSLISGLGMALLFPATNAFYIDITARQHRSRIMGLKESSASLGSVAGPLVLVGVTSIVTARGVFLTAAVCMLGAAFLATLALKAPKPGMKAALVNETAKDRTVPALTALYNVAAHAVTIRERRTGRPSIEH